MCYISYKSTLKLLCNAIVLPHFDYSDIVYDTATETNKTNLQLLQTRAARFGKTTESPTNICKTWLIDELQTEMGVNLYWLCCM